MTDGTFKFGSVLATRMEHLVNNEYLSDVSFAVGKAGEVVVAHKLILTVASEVLHAQFNGNFAESKAEKPIPLPDIEPPVFLEILRYMYCDEVNLSADNVVDVYYGAEKYLLKGLVRVCLEFLEDNIDETNVLKIFNENRQHEFAKVNELCLEMILDDPLLFFEQPAFRNIQQRTLELIIQSPTINCTESQLREAVQMWIDVNEACDMDKLLPVTPTRRMQCRRLSFYGNFGYCKDMKYTLTFTFGKSVNLYGVGIFVGAQNWEGSPSEVTVSVDIETALTAKRVFQKLPIKDELYVHEIVFGKITSPVLTQSTLTITMKSQGLNMFNLDYLNPADLSSELKFNLKSYSLNGSSSSEKRNHIAYLLYNNSNSSGNVSRLEKLFELK